MVITVTGKVTFYNHFGKQFGSFFFFLNKVKHPLSYNSAIPFLVIYPRERT